MVIAQASAPSFQQNDFLLVFGNFSYDFATFGMTRYSTQWYFQDDVLSLGAGFASTTPSGTIPCDHMLLILKVEEGPVLSVTTKYDMASSSAIAAIGPAFGNKFLTTQVCRTRSTFAGASTKFNIVYEIRSGQTIWFMYAALSCKQIGASGKEFSH